MKVSLVVATGVHQGKAIPITGPQFIIGRDPQCHLRPASQAVSKQHCAVSVRDGKVYIKDYGSTNGTIVNDGVLRGEEQQIVNNDSVKVGPLDFTVRIETVPAAPDSTPLPDVNPEAAAALAAVKAAAAPAPRATPRDTTPAPAPAKPAAAEDDHDKLAAMLLGMDDGPAEVPEGSTVMDMPSPLGPNGEVAKPDDKKGGKKEIQTREGMSNAASEILRKYMRRPK